MATIRALKSGKFNVQVRRTGHPPVSDTFDTMTAARKWARKIEGDIDENRHYGYSRVRTLADAIDAFEKSAAKIKTADNRSRHLRWWREHFGARKLFHFTSDVVDQARAQLVAENVDENATRPARHYLMSLSACMEHARRKKKWIERNPVADVDAPPVSPGRIRWLSADERSALLKACDAPGNPELMCDNAHTARTERVYSGSPTFPDVPFQDDLDGYTAPFQFLRSEISSNDSLQAATACAVYDAVNNRTARRLAPVRERHFPAL